MGIKQYPYTKLLLKNNHRKGKRFVLINNGMLKRFFAFFAIAISCVRYILWKSVSWFFVKNAFPMTKEWRPLK